MSTPGDTTAPIGFLYVTSSLPYVGVTPYRIADTRCSANPQPSFCTLENLPSANKALLSPSAGGSITVQVTGTGSDAVPSTAQSVVLNVTAVASSTAKGGYLTVYPTGTNPPTASSLNYIPGATIPNLVTATLGKGGAVSIFSSSADVNIVVDVEGYYEPSNSSSNMFNPLFLPIRVLDTRCIASAQPSYCANEKLPLVNASIPAPAKDAGVAVTVAGVGGSSGVPSTGATAVSLVVTAAEPGYGGYLTVWPDAGSCTTAPMASNVNFYKAISSANSVTVEVGSTGKVCIYNSAATATNVVVDVNGYFSSTGDTLTPSSPVRICDTRSLLALGGTRGDVASGVSGQCANGGVSLNPSASSSDPMTLQVTGIGGIPATAKAVVANVTVVDTTGNGYLQVFSAGATRPSTSNIDWAKGQVRSNMATSALSSSGQIDIYASSGTDVIVDVVGWYS
ncbi:MAG: hypothetical protein ACYDGY_09730 [Acidimicrobiales bacterium]